MPTTAAKIALQVLKIETQGISGLTELFQHQSFEQAADLLSKNQGRIIISGVGKSGIVAKKIAATFASIGKPSQFLHAAEANHGDLGIISSDDLAIIISNSGESSEIFGVIDYCRHFNIPIIAIVGKKNSTLDKAATITLMLPPFEEVSHIAMPTTSTTLISIIGDALAACLVEHGQITHDRYRLYHPGGKIGKNLLKVRDLMRKDNDIPVVNHHSPMSDVLVNITSGLIGCTIVLDDHNEVTGIITDGDLRRHMSADLLKQRALDIMTKNFKSLSPDILAVDGLRFMNTHKITNIVILENKKIVGILNLHDCVRAGLDT